MKAFRIIIFTFCCLFTASVFAQNDLTEKDKKELQERVKMKVEEFQGYLSDIGDTKLSDKEREFHPIKKLSKSLSLTLYQ